MRDTRPFLLETARYNGLLFFDLLLARLDKLAIPDHVQRMTVHVVAYFASVDLAASVGGAMTTPLALPSLSYSDHDPILYWGYGMSVNKKIS